MSSFEDIQKAVNIFKSKNCPFELMHTVSTYPMKDDHANLKVINTLKEKFKCDVGYSGHEAGLVILCRSNFRNQFIRTTYYFKSSYVWI